MTNEQKPEQQKRGRKPLPEDEKRHKRTVYATDKEYEDIQKLLDQKRQPKT